MPRARYAPATVRAVLPWSPRRRAASDKTGNAIMHILGKQKPPRSARGDIGEIDCIANRRLSDAVV
jgi:hypothetical protein